jgi:hypothetical protein
MDIAYRSPLVELFRRGEVAPDVRLLAARGALAPGAYEQLALLLLLTGDPDPEITRVAGATIDAIPRAMLAGFLARSDVGEDVRAFFAARGVDPAAVPREEAAGQLVDCGEGAVADGDDQGEDDGLSPLQRIAAMSVSQRVSLAMRGSREERAVLVRDPNRVVAVAVLSSPKVSDAEVESIARMPNVSDDVLRIIAGARQWTKSYAIVAALTRNAKTPVAIAMNLLGRLNDRDLRLLSTDRNVADVLRSTARRKLGAERR